MSEWGRQRVRNGGRERRETDTYHTCNATKESSFLVLVVCVAFAMIYMIWLRPIFNLMWQYVLKSHWTKLHAIQKACFSFQFSIDWTNQDLNYKTLMHTRLFSESYNRTKVHYHRSRCTYKIPQCIALCLLLLMVMVFVGAMAIILLHSLRFKRKHEANSTQSIAIRQNVLLCVAFTPYKRSQAHNIFCLVVVWS